MSNNNGSGKIFTKYMIVMMLCFVIIIQSASAAQVTVGKGRLDVNSYLYVDETTGNVGVGITSPGYKLDVSGDAMFRNKIRSIYGFLVENISTDVLDGGTNSPYSRVSSDSFHTIGNGDGQMYIEGSAIDANSKIRIGLGIAGGQSIRDVQIGDNNEIFVDTSENRVGIGTASPQATLDVAGIIRAQKICNETGGNCKDLSEAWAVAGSGSVNSLDAADGDPVDAVYVDNDGNMGIGTTSPTAKLSVQYGTTQDIAKFWGTGTNGDRLYITGPIVGISQKGNGVYDGANKHGSLLQIGIDETSSPAFKISKPLFDFQSNGNLGIGTTTPTAKLDVNGKIRGYAVYSGDTGINSPHPSTSSTTSVWSDSLSATISAQKDDIVLVLLSCNLMNTVAGHTTYMMANIHPTSTATVSTILAPNWMVSTMATASSWTGGSSSIGLYKATSDGTLNFRGYWHVSGGTGYHVYCNIIPLVIGKG